MEIRTACAKGGCVVTEGNDRLIDGLIEDLEPVRPLPLLRSAFAIVLAVWAAVLGIVLWSQASPPGANQLLMDRVYFVSFVGLLLSALGATVSTLAGSRPGRDGLETSGLVVSLVGLVVAAGVCVYGIVGLGLDAPSPPGADAMCFQEGMLLSLLPGGVILSFLVRGWASHPIRAAALGLVAAGALGGAIVHLSCDFLAPAHLMVGHLSVPLALAIVGLYPLGALLRRVRG